MCILLLYNVEMQIPHQALLWIWNMIFQTQLRDCQGHFLMLSQKKNFLSSLSESNYKKKLFGQSELC